MFQVAGPAVNGHAHNFYTIGVTGLLVFAYVLRPDDPSAIWAASGSALTLLVNPDSDMEIHTTNERRLIQRVPILGRLWVATWWPYAKMFRHRGVSHWPVIGTATRAGYLFLLVTAGMMIVGASAYWDEVTGPAAGMFVGMCVSDIVHFIMDW